MRFAIALPSLSACAPDASTVGASASESDVPRLTLSQAFSGVADFALEGVVEGRARLEVELVAQGNGVSAEANVWPDPELLVEGEPIPPRGVAFEADGRLVAASQACPVSAGCYRGELGGMMTTEGVVFELLEEQPFLTFWLAADSPAARVSLFVSDPVDEFFMAR